MAIAVPGNALQEWKAWVQSNIAKPFRKRAYKAAVKALGSGASPEQAAAVAKQAEQNRANYMAASALILGLISAVVGLSLGGLSILATLFAIASAVQGRYSAENRWMAWVGLGLAILGVIFFIVRLALR